MLSNSISLNGTGYSSPQIQTNNGVNKMHELELNMYEEIFLFTTNPITDYLILFVVGVIIIGWCSRYGK